MCITRYRGADKSLARPGRKNLQRPNSNFQQATQALQGFRDQMQKKEYRPCVIKGTGVLISPQPDQEGKIYNDQILTFASHSKKNSESCPSNQFAAAAMTSASDEKQKNIEPFYCFFLVSGRAKDLSAPLCICSCSNDNEKKIKIIQKSLRSLRTTFPAASGTRTTNVMATLIIQS